MNKLTKVVMIIAGFVILGVSIHSVANATENKVKKMVICHKGKTLVLPKDKALGHLKEHEEDYRGRCEKPEVTPTPTPEVDPTPTPTSSPNPRIISDTSNPPIACTATAPEKLPWDTHVIRNGSDATVKAFIPEGDKVNVYYKENGSDTWTHALGDVPVIDDGQRRVEVTIHDLVPATGYTFGIQAVNSCTGSEILAVIIDPPSYGEIFEFSHWEVLR